MALITKRFDLRKVSKESLGLILFTQFLETGILVVKLEKTDVAWLEDMWSGEDAIDSLHHCFFLAAANNGYSSTMEDWNFTTNEDVSFEVWDPKRITDRDFA